MMVLRQSSQGFYKYLAILKKMLEIVYSCWILKMALNYITNG
jgi:hypothetical protein